jgi:hypothetical protein
MITTPLNNTALVKFIICAGPLEISSARIRIICASCAWLSLALGRHSSYI